MSLTNAYPKHIKFLLHITITYKESSFQQMLFEAISGVKQGDSLNHCWLIIAMIYQTDNLKLFLFTNTCKQ